MNDHKKTECSRCWIGKAERLNAFMPGPDPEEPLKGALWIKDRWVCRSCDDRLNEIFLFAHGKIEQISSPLLNIMD